LVASKFVISQLSDLSDIRALSDLSQVTIIMNSKIFKNDQVLYAIKFAIFSLKKNGKLVIDTRSLANSMTLNSPGKLSFQMLSQMLAIAGVNWGSITVIDPEKQYIEYRRERETTENRWSAGVVFSGNRSEVPFLTKCLSGLLIQPELRASQDIIVFGPSAAESMLALPLGVKYIGYESELVCGRFLVGKKKNALVRHLSNEKIIICHSRIVLEEGALGAMPSDFDMVTPKVEVKTDAGRLSYLDLGFLPNHFNTLVVDRYPVPIFYERATWLDYIKNFIPYIDGGVFVIRRELALKIPIHETIAWGEGEDVEWSKRLLNSGNTLELCLGSVAISQTCKATTYFNYGHFQTYRLLLKMRNHLVQVSLQFFRM